jgi:hypothetical protein
MDLESVVATNEYGDEFWKSNGYYHREDGPAIIYKNGTQSWYSNGELHRADGPAIITNNGDLFWFVKGNNITKNIEQWMIKREISWPFDDEARVEFSLSWT